jgi:hypothetical protein
MPAPVGVNRVGLTRQGRNQDRSRSPSLFLSQGYDEFPAEVRDVRDVGDDAVPDGVGGVLK